MHPGGVPAAALRSFACPSPVVRVFLFQPCLFSVPGFAAPGAPGFRFRGRALRPPLFPTTSRRAAGVPAARLPEVPCPGPCPGPRHEAGAATGVPGARSRSRCEARPGRPLLCSPPPGAARNNGCESTLGSVLIFCMSPGARTEQVRDEAAAPKCAGGGIGRRAGFRFQCPQGRGGSTPPSRTRRNPLKRVSARDESPGGGPFLVVGVARSLCGCVCDTTVVCFT